MFVQLGLMHKYLNLECKLNFEIKICSSPLVLLRHNSDYKSPTGVLFVQLYFLVASKVVCFLLLKILITCLIITFSF